ncbi:MAG TPA: hypothetical protein PLD84_11785, partial [Chitinophagales bacterium]|nr:hypothetical protein [Chitinophagales bacterium]
MGRLITNGQLRITSALMCTEAVNQFPVFSGLGETIQPFGDAAIFGSRFQPFHHSWIPGKINF